MYLFINCLFKPLCWFYEPQWRVAKPVYFYFPRSLDKYIPNFVYDNFVCAFDQLASQIIYYKQVGERLVDH